VFTLPRGGPLRRLQLLLGLALMGVLLVPRASAAAQLDTVTATGSTGPLTPPIVTRFGLVSASSIDIAAQSDTSGQNPSGTASFALGGLTFSGRVTCLSVTGPDNGGGSAMAPTTAVLRFQDSNSGLFVTVQLVDNGGNGADTMSFAAGTAPSPSACSVSGILASPETGTLTNGRATVFDAPVVPTSDQQCMRGGWRNFPQFKNQGDCVSFVETGK
jgi:hypothetical protein